MALSTESVHTRHQPQGTKVSNISVQISVVQSPCLLYCRNFQCSRSPNIYRPSTSQTQGLLPTPAGKKRSPPSQALSPCSPCPHCQALLGVFVRLGLPGAGGQGLPSFLLGPIWGTNSILCPPAEPCARLYPAGGGGCPGVQPISLELLTFLLFT